MASLIIADFEKDEDQKEVQSKLIRSIDDYVMSLNAPKIFDSNSEDNALVAMDLSFEKLCTSMEEAGISTPKKLTVFEFNGKLDYFESKKTK